jgi:hypothetical protein
MAPDADNPTLIQVLVLERIDRVTLRIKLHDKRAALVDIGRHLGMFANKVELGGDANNPIRVETVNEDAREYILGELARLASRRRQIEDHRPQRSVR